MSANTAQQKAPWVLAAILLSQVVLMSTQARHPESEQSIFRTWLMAALTPVAGVIDGAFSGVSGAVSSYTDLRGAREENIQLREQLEKLTAERDQARERAKELELLKAQLALPSLPQYREIAANVISRNSSLWFRRLTIDRGTLDGVKRNMPVVTGTGVVGRVISVGPNFAMVQVITDKHAGLGAMLQLTREMGEVRGRDPADALCELKNIAANKVVEVGETVVTTGLDRIYPKGLVIGTVERIDNDPNAPWHKIIVKPSAPVDRVEHVLVLLVEQKDLQMEEIKQMEETNK
jgi:rod shape-determining protein MreC